MLMYDRRASRWSTSQAATYSQGSMRYVEEGGWEGGENGEKQQRQ